MIEWIQFGQVAAERDEFLSKYFYDNGVLKKVIDSRNRFLVLGRKGAGKTAVFRHLDENFEDFLDNSDISISMSLENYNWEVHKLLSNPEKAVSLAYIESWKYFIYLSCLAAINECEGQPHQLRAVTKLVSKIYGSPVPSIGEIIGQKVLRLSKIALPSGGASGEDGSLESIELNAGEIEFSDVLGSESLRSRLSHSLSRVVILLEQELQRYFIDAGHRVFVNFDRIDEAWVVESVEPVKPMISGLVGAAETITQKFDGAIRPLVFLREDIFDTLSLNDKNKLRSDCGELLAWRADSLNRLIMQRVNYFAREAGADERTEVNDLFDKPMMRQTRKPFDYLLMRTMMRPRDLIRFLQLTRDDMVDRKHNIFEQEEVNEDCLECDAIYNAEPQYSTWLRNELLDEWSTQFPAIKSLFEALTDIATTVFSAADLKASLRKVGVDASDIDVASYLRFMFENSIIGFKVGKSQQWRFKCFYQSQGFLDSDAYKVHDGLIRSLNLKEPRSSQEQTEQT